jgi:hypothetical protein
VGRRSRQRNRDPGRLEPHPVAANRQYADTDGNLLELRSSLSAGARLRYSDTLHGGLDREDARQRATELLFELLAVRWTIAAAPIDRQRELLGRYRAASPAEREFVRQSLRSHAQEYFPELETT